MNILENSLRIKITGRCNRNCFFCHQEGGMNDISDINYTSDLHQILDRMSCDFGINKIAITGGEPLLFDGLLTFTEKIKKNTNISGFSLTTNGSIYKDDYFWDSMKKNGLYKINLSISDILDSVKVLGLPEEMTVFQNQMYTIKLLNCLGFRPTINVVVYNDKKYLFNVLNTLFSQPLDFDIALLPDLTNPITFNYSQKIITSTLSTLDCKQESLSHRQGTSNTVCDFITNGGKKLQVKTTKIGGAPKWLSTICDDCTNKRYCQEGFYGLRLEKKGNDLMIRLCLYKSDTDVLMPVDAFYKSNVYSELKQLWAK